MRGLVALARPIPIAELATVLQFDEAEIADACADLAPGVRNDGGFLSFADEDLEAFVREAAQDAIADVRRRTANRFLERALTDPGSIGDSSEDAETLAEPTNAVRPNTYTFAWRLATE